MFDGVLDKTTQEELDKVERIIRAELVRAAAIAGAARLPGQPGAKRAEEEVLIRL